jgi:hypothetical protein
MEGVTAQYVLEIPPGKALNPEKHLYEEVFYVLDGRGSMQVWGGSSDARVSCEWQPGSFLVAPLNTWHQFFNGSGTESALILATTNAPIILDIYHDLDFVFNCDFAFRERWDARPDYFQTGERQFVGDYVGVVWETNFVPDVRAASIDDHRQMGWDSRTNRFEIGGNTLTGHLNEFPTGRYQRAHAHGGGAVLTCVRSHGYSLMWPPEAGITPFENGKGHLVEKVRWGDGSTFSPPTGWYHQHLNTGPEPARLLAFRYASARYPAGFFEAHNKKGAVTSIRQGGTLIDFEDEDPEIRRRYRQELAENGVPFDMPEPSRAS